MTPQANPSDAQTPTPPLASASVRTDPSLSRSGSNSVPSGIRGWSWGAFFLGPMWAARHRVWIGLFALVPVLGIVFAILLGAKGREWAWKANRWKSVAEFNVVQRKWSIYGTTIFVLFVALSVWAE